MSYAAYLLLVAPVMFSGFLLGVLFGVHWGIADYRKRMQEMK